MRGQYKTELHLHTSEVSPCAHQTATEIADVYLREGYTTVVVTNHYCDYVMYSAGETWEERFAYFLKGYRAMKEYAGDRLHVLLGAELRFEECGNDYLIFGLTEDFLRDHPDLHKMTLRSFSALAKEHGLLIVQAHPFRNGMKILPTELIDGYEVFNASPGHHSRNDLALLYCKKYQKIPTSGSDFHHEGASIAVGGILTDSPITSMDELVETLCKGDYSLLCSGPSAERDGIVPFAARDLNKL